MSTRTVYYAPLYVGGGVSGNQVATSNNCKTGDPEAFVLVSGSNPAPLMPNATTTIQWELGNTTVFWNGQVGNNASITSVDFVVGPWAANTEPCAENKFVFGFSLWFWIILLIVILVLIFLFSRKV